MKNILVYALSLVMLSLGACNETLDNWAAPQGFEQEEMINANLEVAPVSPIDIATITEERIPLFTITAIPSEATITKYNVTLDGASIDVDKDGLVATKDLAEIVAELYGKRPTERTMAGVVNVCMNLNNQIVRSSANVEVKVTPAAPVIETEYYLVGSLTGWAALDNSLKFNHSNEDVYDDPVFTLVVAAPVDTTGKRVDLYFKIAPKSAYDGDADHFWKSLLGAETDGDESLEAALKIGVDGAFKQPATDGAKFYSITLNMMDYTVTIAPLAFDEFIYVPGNYQNWKPESAPALQSPNFDGVYTGYSYLNGEFKFTKARNWKAEYNWNDFSEVNELFTQGGGSNINITTPGFYQITVDIPNSSLEAVLTSWGIIGDATSGGWDTDTQMTYNPSDESWSVTADFTVGGFKFRANKDWKINYGGSIENLNFDGSNIAIEEAGNYTIKLYLTRSTSPNIYCTITKN